MMKWSELVRRLVPRCARGTDAPTQPVAPTAPAAPPAAAPTTARQPAALPEDVASLLDSLKADEPAGDAVEQLAWLNAENEIDAMVAKWQAAIEHKPVVPIQDSQGRIDDLLERAGPDVGLYGETTGIPVQTLIQMAEVGARSGRLWIRTVYDLFWFDLRRGRIARTGCEGTDTTGERLGEILVGHGVLQPQDVRAPVEESRKRRLPLGAVLLEKELVSRDQLHEAIRQQSILRLANALFAPHAAYAFCQDASNVPSPIDNVGIDPRDLLEASGHLIGDGLRVVD